MRVVINQSNYFPWIGYFGLIASADLFVFLDNVQYTTRDWRNRNRIRVSGNNDWISIPCGNNRNRLIDQVKWTDNEWRQDHWNKIEQAYHKAPDFNRHANFVHDLINNDTTSLSELNQHLIISIYNKFINKPLPEIRSANSYHTQSRSSDLMLNICKLSRATNYLTGPAAKAYLDEEAFLASGISVSWASYQSLIPIKDSKIYSILDDIFYNSDDISSKIEIFKKLNNQAI